MDRYRLGLGAALLLIIGGMIDNWPQPPRPAPPSIETGIDLEWLLTRTPTTAPPPGYCIREDAGQCPDILR